MNNYGIFSKNKQKVREMNLKIIKTFSDKKKIKLRYLGLPSEEMKDIIYWKKYINHISAIERGIKGQEYIRQHNLTLKAFTLNLSEIFKLFRGEMDEILLNNKDINGQKLEYPYTLLNLDYTGGIIYKEEKDTSNRINSLKNFFKNQSKFKHDFLLFITCNFDNEIESEYKHFISNFISKTTDNKKETIIEYYNKPLNIIKLKIITLSLIQNIAKEFFECIFYKPIYYKGNKDTNMINFAFEFKYVDKYITEKKIKYTDSEIINYPIFICKNGNIENLNLNLPKI